MCYMFGFLIGSVLFGVLSDRAGRKVALVVSVVSSSLLSFAGRQSINFVFLQTWLSRWLVHPLLERSLIKQLGFHIPGSFATDYWTYLVLRLFCGIAAKGLFMLAFMFSVEVSGFKYKMYLGILIQVSRLRLLNSVSVPRGLTEFFYIFVHHKSVFLLAKEDISRSTYYYLSDRL